MSESTFQKSWAKIIIDPDVLVEEDVSGDETKEKIFITSSQI
jgi:hypothetical protein